MFMIIDLFLFPVVIAGIIVDIPYLLFSKIKISVYQFTDQWRHQVRSVVKHELKLFQTDVSNQMMKSHVTLRKTMNDMINANLEAHAISSKRSCETLMIFEQNARTAEAKIELLTSHIENMGIEMQRSINVLKELVPEKCDTINPCHQVSAPPPMRKRPRKNRWPLFLRKKIIASEKK